VRSAILIKSSCNWEFVLTLEHMLVFHRLTADHLHGLVKHLRVTFF
jgi:hypothetical protein